MWKVPIDLGHTTASFQWKVVDLSPKNGKKLIYQKHSFRDQWELSPGAAWSTITNASSCLCGSFWIQQGYFVAPKTHWTHFCKPIDNPGDSSEWLYVHTKCHLISHLGLPNKIRDIYCLFLQFMASGLYVFVFWSIVWKRTIVMNSKANIFWKLKSCTCWIGRWVMPDIQAEESVCVQLKGWIVPTA